MKCPHIFVFLKVELDWVAICKKPSSVSVLIRKRKRFRPTISKSKPQTEFSIA